MLRMFTTVQPLTRSQQDPQKSVDFLSADSSRAVLISTLCNGETITPNDCEVRSESASDNSWDNLLNKFLDSLLVVGLPSSHCERITKSTILLDDIDSSSVVQQDPSTSVLKTISEENSFLAASFSISVNSLMLAENDAVR